MATTYYTDIQKLYVAYFNRPADVAGLAYYEGVLEAAKGSATVMAQISADFAKSTEYTAAFSGKTNAEIVDIIYTNIFGHAADAAGNKFYADNLTAGKVTVANVVQEVAKGAQGTDLVAYNNKVTAAGVFTAAVDTDAEKAGYSGDAANKVAKAFLTSITDNVSLTANTTPAALNTAVAATVAAGTPFSVAGALAQISGAQASVDAYVKATVTTDVNTDGAKNAADIGAAQTKALTTVSTDIGGASGTLFAASTTSQVVRDALVSAQQATNAATLSTAQATLAADNAAIAKVAGLTDAVALVTASLSAQKSAVAAEVLTHADIQAKEAAFGTINGGTYSKSSTAITFTPAGGSAVVLADITNGKAALHTGVDATKYTGLTDLITSFNAEATAVANVTAANTNVANSQLVANMLDIAPDAAGTIGSTGLTEQGLIDALALQINTTTPKTVAAGDTPTLAQIQTELAVLNAKTDKTDYNAFKALVDAETVGLSSAQLTANGNVTTAANLLASDKTAAATAHSNYVTELTTFKAADTTLNAGTVSVSGNALVLTNGTTVTTLADLNATTKVATVHAGIDEVSNPDVTNLIAKYNADVNAAATVTTDTTNLTNLKATAAAVDATNPLTATQATDAAAVTAASAAITKLAKDVAALSTANANADTLAGLNASVKAYSDALKDKGFVIDTLDATHSGLVTQFGTAASDIFMVKGFDATIAAFGLQGTDSLFVGSGYTLVKGAIDADGVTANDAAMEIFVSTSGTDAVLQIETHAYSSNFMGTAGEIVTITLTGVDATTLHLDNGIITSGTPTV
jgi:hypothetical protein